MKQSLCLLLLSCLLFSSCIGIESSSEIKEDGKIQLKLVYSVSPAIDELGKIGANQVYLPLAIGKEDMQLAASRAGADLRSWKREDSSQLILITANIDFPDPYSFALFLDPSGELAVYSLDANINSLTLILSRGNTIAEPDFVDFIKTVFDNYEVSLKFTLPSKPVSVKGFTVNDKIVNFKMKAADIFSSKEPLQLNISWKK